MEEPVSYINDNDEKVWYLPSKGKDYYHRLDGPAIERADGSKYWCVNGKRHRLDGPAFERADGTRYWCVNGNQLPTEEVETWLKENQVDLTTQEGQLIFKLRWL